MSDKFIHTAISFLLIASICFSMDYIQLQKDVLNIINLADSIHHSGLDNDPQLSKILFQSVGISAWFNMSAIVDSPIVQLIQQQAFSIFNLNNPISNNSYTTNITYTANLWRYIFAQVDYYSGRIKLYFNDINTGEFGSLNGSISSTTWPLIIQDIYVGGDISSICSCSLSQVYIIPNNYIASISQIYQLAGGDISKCHKLKSWTNLSLDYQVWYIFTDSSTIKDISGNLPDVTPNNNQNLYSSGQIPSLNTSENSFTIKGNSSILLPKPLKNWFTPSAPSLTISFHLKLDPIKTGYGVMGLDRISTTTSAGSQVFTIRMSVQSGNVDYLYMLIGYDGYLPDIPIGYNIKDNTWHYCLIQLLYVVSTGETLQYVKIDDFETGWIPYSIMQNFHNINLYILDLSENYYQDSSDDNVFIEGWSSDPEDLGWKIKNFIITSGLFQFNSLQNCVVDFGSTILWGPNSNSPVSSTSTCLKCPVDFCRNIDNTTKNASCSKCPSGSYVSNPELLLCENRCIPCTYPITSDTCCNNKYQECYGPSETNCLSCNSASSYPYFFGNSCIATCPSNYYSDNNNKCQPYDTNCKTCIDSSINCNSCFDGLYLSTLTNTCNKFTQGHLDVSQFDTLDVYLTFNSTLYSDNILNLNELLQLLISDLANNDYSYSIYQVSNTNITFRLSINQMINHNMVTLKLQNLLSILDSNNHPILPTINNARLGLYNPITKMSLSAKLMALIGTAVVIGSFPMIISGGLGALWGLIDGLQLLFYFIYLDMEIPIEFKKFLIFFKIVTIPLPNIPVLFFNILQRFWNISLPESQSQRKFDEFEIDALFIRTGLLYIIYLILSFISIGMIIGVEKIIYKLTGIQSSKNNSKNGEMEFINKIYTSQCHTAIIRNIYTIQQYINRQWILYSKPNHYYNIISIHIIIYHLGIQTNCKQIIHIQKINFYYSIWCSDWRVCQNQDQKSIICGQKFWDYPNHQKNSIYLWFYHTIQLCDDQSNFYNGSKPNNDMPLEEIFTINKEIIQFEKYYTRNDIDISCLALLLIYQDIIPKDMLKIIDYGLIILCSIYFLYSLVFIGIDLIKGIKPIIISMKGYYKSFSNKRRKRLAQNLFELEPNILGDANNINSIVNIDDRHIINLNTGNNNNTNTTEQGIDDNSNSTQTYDTMTFFKT